MNLKPAVIAILSLCLLASCSTKRSPLTYFEDISDVYEQMAPTDNYSLRIQPDDELFIAVLSLSPEASAIYNLPYANPATNSELLQTQQPSQMTYIVDTEGNINFPVLGKLHVEGMTTEQLRDELIKRISVEVEDPQVTVRLLNFRVNVAGEVKQAGPQKVTTERYSVLDALTAAGDLTEFGERNNVLVIREEDGKRVAHRLDLNSSELLTSPYFYLKQNDYVYVSPNKIRQDNSKYNQNNAFKVSVVSTIVSGCSVIASLVIALTVK